MLFGSLFIYLKYWIFSTYGNKHANLGYFNVDPNKPGVLKVNKDIKRKGVFGNEINDSLNVEYTILYLDDLVVLGFSCSTIPNFWFGEQLIHFFILIKHYEFNDLTYTAYLIKLLQETGVSLNVNDFMLYYHDCKNRFGAAFNWIIVFYIKLDKFRNWWMFVSLILTSKLKNLELNELEI